MDVNSISALSIKDLDAIKTQIDSLFNEVKASKELLEEALCVKFSDKTHELLTLAGQDTGTVSFEQEDYLISAQIPKKVTWDQDKLSSLIARIPTEERNKYIETNYKINEQRYLAYFPLSLRDILDEAREVSTGKLKLSLKLKG